MSKSGKTDMPHIGGEKIVVTPEMFQRMIDSIYANAEAQGRTLNDEEQHDVNALTEDLQTAEERARIKDLFPAAPNVAIKAILRYLTTLDLKNEEEWSEAVVVMYNAQEADNTVTERYGCPLTQEANRQEAVVRVESLRFLNDAERLLGEMRLADINPSLWQEHKPFDFSRMQTAGKRRDEIMEAFLTRIYKYLPS